MLSGHETADFSSIQISTLIITDHSRAKYYLAEFFVKHNHIKLSRLILKKVKTEFFIFLSPEKPKNHMEPL